MTAERTAWLQPYYNWKERLEKFGLQKEEIELPGFFLPMTVYRYHEGDNSFKGKRYGIRNKAVVEI